MADLITNTYNSGIGRAVINNSFSGQTVFNLVQTRVFSSQPLSLLDSPTIVWDYSLGHNAFVTLAGNRTLSITNMSNGGYGTLMVMQDASGGRTLSLGVLPNNKVVSGGTGSVILTSASNAIDILTFFYEGSYFYWNIENNFTTHP